MPWSRSTQAAQGLPELASIEECSTVLQQDLVILFKHSPTCPVSWMAHKEVAKFRAKHPEIQLHLISVRNRRDISNFVADRTGIVHESPQLIVFRSGQPVADASHDEITAEYIAAACGLTR